MSIFFLTALLVSSPYPFELKTGFSIEPTVDYLFKDKIDDDKAVGGFRFSYLYGEPSDTIITSEIQILSATQFNTPTSPNGSSRLVTHTDYFFEAGFCVYEIYHPVAFRLAGGGGVEWRREVSPDLYYRAGLGHYFSKYLGVFVDLGGRFIFRSEESDSAPINLGSSLQIVF
jgi:hypothetical protein